MYNIYIYIFMYEFVSYIYMIIMYFRMYNSYKPTTYRPLLDRSQWHVMCLESNLEGVPPVPGFEARHARIASACWLRISRIWQPANQDFKGILKGFKGLKNDLKVLFQAFSRISKRSCRRNDEKKRA